MLNQGKGGRGRGGCNLGKGSARNSAFIANLNAPKSDGKGSVISECYGYKNMQNWSVLANPPSTNQFSEFSDPYSRDFDFWEPSNHIPRPLHQISEFSEPFHEFSEFSEPFHEFSEPSNPSKHISDPIEQISDPIHQSSAGAYHKNTQKSTPVNNQDLNFAQKVPKSHTPRKKRALDLFSGSGSVAHALRQK